MHFKAFNIFACLLARSLRNFDKLARVEELQKMLQLAAEAHANSQMENLAVAGGG